LVPCCLERLVHVLELLDGDVDRQVEGVDGQTIDGSKPVVKTWGVNI
jgi:hypothetical protein